MTTVEAPSHDRRRTLAVAEDAQRIERLAQEFQRNAHELEDQARKLRGTLSALEPVRQRPVNSSGRGA